MAEIDFDELDKAVSSLMENVKKPNQQPTSEVGDKPADNTQDNDSQDNDEANRSQQGDETTEDSESIQSDTDTTASDQTATPTPTIPSESEESTAPRPSLANKRRGQFMDMKHASADMRAVPAAAKPMSRIGASLRPISSTAGPEGEQEKKELTTPQAPVDNVASDELAGDLESTASAADTSDTLLLLTGDDNDISTENDSEVRDEDNDTPTSPFLSGTKVEKRPLGMPTPVTNEDESIDSATQDNPDTDASSQGRPLTHGTELSVSSESIAPAASPTKLPEELHSSVLEVEADTTAVDDKSGVEESQNQADGEQEFDTPPKTAEIKDSEASDDTEQSAEKHAPTSIPPQYKAKKADDAAMAQEPQVSMYDTAVDHPTLAQPKKTSHWAIVIVIIILVLLGALAGAALYLYQTGTLSLV
jgi:hypothetical protein